MSSGSQPESAIMGALRRLVVQGWLPLRQLSPLLGYSHGTGIYGRQRGPNAIPTIKVGGTLRVYEADIIYALENVREEDRGASIAILTRYKQLQKEHEQNE